MLAPALRTAPVDVLILGAGPAGLTVAQGLCRLLHTAIVFSSSNFRNARAAHMHGIPTWEHRDPADFRKATREDILAHYDTVSFQDVSIKNIERTEREDGTSLFKATDETGKEWWGRKVVLATGIKDIMLDIPGYEENWARSIFHCLFCHGYEERGGPSAGLLAVGDSAQPFFVMHVARMANRLADTVTIYTNGDPAVEATLRESLSQVKPTSKTARCVSIEPRKIAKFVKGEKGSDIVVHFEDGESKVEAFIAHKPVGVPTGGWIEMLGLEKTPQGLIKVGAPFPETSVNGVFAAGDCAMPFQAASMTLGQAPIVAAGVSAQLLAED